MSNVNETLWAKRVEKSMDCLAREISGETVLLNLMDEKYYSLDDVGTRFLSVMTQSPSLDEAARSLLEEYEVEEAELRADLASLVQSLLERDMVTLVGADQ